MLPTTVMLIFFNKKNEIKNNSRKKRNILGGQAEVPLIATNIYRAMVKKIFLKKGQSNKILGLNIKKKLSLL